MKLGKELMLFSVVSIVFLAGCAGAPESATGTGVIIKSFAPDLTSVEGGSQVVMTVVVKNVGARAAGTAISGISASGVGATLFGLSNEWGGVTTSKVITSSLAAADPATGLPGEEASIDWTLTTPTGKGSDVTYDASVRVNYTYSTISDALLRFVTTDYEWTNPNIQKGVISSETTAGPLSITIFARTPTVSGATRIGKLQFEIQNVGGGRVGNETIAGLDIIREIKVVGVTPTAGGTVGQCGGKKDADDASDKVITLNDVRLAAGKSKIISCDVDVGAITNFQDIALNITANYQFFVDSATQATVLRALQ